MGVTGLWKLIEPCGKPVPVETLEGKVLAVDISIWLHQVVKGFQDSKGSALQNAHLLGLFHRLCKLLYYRVRPVFVFDGCVPQLKRDTIARRQQQRNKLNNEADRIQALLLQSLAKEKVVQEALGTEAAGLLVKSPIKRFGKSTSSDDVDDIFKLPEMPSTSKDPKSKNPESDDKHDSSAATDDFSISSFSSDDSSFDESNPVHSYYSNLQAIDVRSQYFRNLPADVRHEILVDIKETRKQSSWGRLHELPSRSVDFSQFQMKRLLKRRAVQESLEEAEQEMGGRSLTYAELNNMFTEDGILPPSALEKNSNQICSDENTRYLLVRDLKKKLSKIEELQEPKTEKLDPELIDTDSDIKLKEMGNPVPPQELKTEDIKKTELGSEFNADLELALALSLEEEEARVYNEKDYEYESAEILRLNREQRKNLQDAAIGPARAFMIEYGGLNEEEVIGIMEKSQINASNEFEDMCEKDCREQSTAIEPNLKIQVSAKNDEGNNEKKECKVASTVDKIVTSAECCLQVSDGSDETDSDLEEVLDCEDNRNDMKFSTNGKHVEIVLDLKEPLKPEEDLFADIFDDKIVEITSSTEDMNSCENQNVKEQKSSIAKENELIVKEPVESCKDIKLPSNEGMLSILSDLKKQAADVKDIKLSDIQIDLPKVLVSNDNSTKDMPITEKVEINPEVIEICDSDDDVKVVPNTPSKSPKTPTKATITEYFETEYKIKRTPEKLPIESEEPPKKVVSPFYVNKNKNLKEKQSSTSPTPSSPQSRAAKALFPTKTAEEELEKTPLTAEDIIKDAAEVLKEQKTSDELKELAIDLANERHNLESERNRQDRMSTSISQRMSTDCQELLRLFGIPYIVAPMEAEAQCAFLDSVELTNGTITDDSDIWLFGGRTVYKNFFAQNKHVLEFRADKIEQSFNCDRNKLIQLACLVGSDYTTGVHGIGAVTAIEILASFSGQKESINNESNNSARNVIDKILSTLSKFRDWWIANKTAAAPPGSSVRLALRKKLKNIELHEGFPSPAVIEAYLMPKVDENKETFMWGTPDVESIREFTKKTFGWTRAKTDEILTPVLKKINEKKTQATIKNYFNVKSALSIRELKVSKRVQKAIEKMATGVTEDTPEKPKAKKVSRKRRTKATQNIDSHEEPKDDGVDDGETGKVASKHFAKPTKAKRGKRKQSTSEAQPTMDGPEQEIENAALTIEVDALPSTSKIAKIEIEKKVNLPNTKEIIPQREKSLKQLLSNREKAIEILKQAEGTEAKKKRKS